MITGLPTAMTVRARQKLKTPQAAEKFNEELLAKIQAAIEKGVTPSFDDFDISQNPLPFEQFEALFNTFQSTGVRVQRVRMFGCTTLDDNVMALMADWLRTVTAENAPHEMHLTDCAITSVGFTAFTDALESNDAFPTADRGLSRCPLYVRFENNYIQPDSVIQDKVNEGVVVEYQKNSGPIRAPVASAPEAKMKLVCQSNGRYQQRSGEPPAPKDAPPPKQVWDRYAEEQEMQKGGGKGKGYNADPWGWSPQAMQAAWQALPAPTAWGGNPYGGKGHDPWQQPQHQQAYGKGTAAPQVQYGQKGGYSPAKVPPQNHYAQAAPVQSHAAFAAQTRPAGGKPSAFNAFGPQQQNGNQAAGKGGAAQRATDRSRTPQPKVQQKAAGGLPPGWEEHFSDEYQIPYYWNTASGESLWEKP